MQQSSSINDILSHISTLSLDEQSYIAEVVHHRIHEQQRNQLSKRIKEAELNYTDGNVTTGTIDDLFVALEDD